MNVEFRVLGPLEVLVDGEPISVPAGRGRVLLATLLVRPNRFVSVDELVDRLWDGAPPTADRAHKTLQTTVLRLRQALGAANRVRTTAGGYLVEVTPAELDLLRFREFVRAGDNRSATELWRGAALANVASDVLHREEVPRLEEERLGALERRIDADLDRGQDEHLVVELSELVGQHPMRERFWAQLMTALARAGRQAEALEAYRRITALLAEELGVDPSPELSRLHLAVLNGETEVPQRRVICQLPPDTPGFVGRTDVLRQVDERLTAGGVPVVVLTGAPGVGKSALTIKAAHRLRHRFPDGQLFTRLNGAGGDPRDPSEVLTELLVALDVPASTLPDGLEARSAVFRDRLADRSMLVVLDDAAGAEQVRPLLPGTPGCAVLISSRQQLVQVEGVRTLRVLPLAAEDGVALLSSVLGEERAGTDPSAVSEIAGACGGLPLALRVAGARLAARESLPLRSLARRLSDERHRLDELAMGDLEVRATFGPSYEALPEAAATAFRRLGLLGAKDVAAWTVGVLAGGDGERLAERLVEANLLEEVGLDVTGEPRYRLHDLLAVYAAELVRAEDPQVVAAAMRDYVGLLLTLMEFAVRDWQGGDQMPIKPVVRSTALDRAEVERLAFDVRFMLAEKVNIDHAVMYCLRANRVDDAAEVVDLAYCYLDVYMSHERAVQLGELIRDAALAAGNELVAWRAQFDVLIQRTTRGITEELLAGYARCAEMFEEMGAQTELAALLGTLAYYTMVQTGQPQIELAERAVAAARASGVTNLYVGNLRELGTMLASAGRYEDSVPVLDEALELSRPDSRGETALVLSRIASSALAAGDLRRAESACREALELSKAGDDIRGIAYCTIQLSRIDLALGDPGIALVEAEKALAILEGLGERRRIVRALAAIAEANLALGLSGKVIAEATAALEAYGDAGDSDAEERLRAALEQARRKA